MLPPVAVDPEEARDVADRVLSGRAYVEAAKPLSLRERFLNWLGDIFTDLLEALTSSGGRGLMAWAIFGFFALAVLFLIWRLAKTYRDFGPKQTTSTPDAMVDITRNLSAEQWLHEAAEAEDGGDWRNGLRCRHRALVTELMDAELVTARPGLTAGQINDELVRSVPAAQADMQEATWLFKDAWYGWSDPGAAERDRFRELAERIVLAAARRPAGTGAADAPSMSEALS